MNFASINYEQIELFILVFVRVGAILTLLPVFGSEFLPNQIKAGLAFLVAVLVFPYVQEHYAGVVAFSFPVFIVGLMRELFIGMVIGFASMFLFSAVQFAGFLIDSQMGFAMVQAVDPTTETEITITGQLHLILFTLIFLLFNGHYFFILAIQKSFELIPIMGAHFAAGPLTSLFLDMSSNVFAVSMQLAAPVFIVLLLVDLGLAIIARTVPQINIFFVGLPVKIGVGLGTMILCLPMLAKIFEKIAGKLIEDIWKLLYLLA